MNITSTEMAVAIISASGQAYEKMLKEAGVPIRAHYYTTDEGVHMAEFTDYSALSKMSNEDFAKLITSDEMPECISRVIIMCQVSDDEVIIMKNSARLESEEYLQIVNEVDITRLENGELFTMLRERRPSLLNI
ncbi:hypothetical protein IKD57_03355 [Candidatus Saccharibacteria bacterium]|nr:hypothetical protein [Candidatus Saccharibacteria bacterium]